MADGGIDPAGLPEATSRTGEPRPPEQIRSPRVDIDEHRIVLPATPARVARAARRRHDRGVIGRGCDLIESSNHLLESRVDVLVIALYDPEDGERRC